MINKPYLACFCPFHKDTPYHINRIDNVHLVFKKLKMFNCAKAGHTMLFWLKIINAEKGITHLLYNFANIVALLQKWDLLNFTQYLFEFI